MEATAGRIDESIFAETRHDVKILARLKSLPAVLPVPTGLSKLEIARPIQASTGEVAEWPIAAAC